MLPVQQLQTPFSLVIADAPTDHSELCRLLAAAVVNRDFCALLLDDPAMALQCGYFGETFRLADADRDLLLSLRADSLADLAGQLVNFIGVQPDRDTVYYTPRLEFVQ